MAVWAWAEHRILDALEQVVPVSLERFGREIAFDVITALEVSVFAFGISIPEGGCSQPPVSGCFPWKTVLVGSDLDAVPELQELHIAHDQSDNSKGPAIV